MKKNLIVDKVSKIVADHLSAYGFVESNGDIVKIVNDIRQGIRISGGKFKAGTNIRLMLYTKDISTESSIDSLGLNRFEENFTTALEIDQLDPNKSAPQGYWIQGDTSEDIAELITQDLDNLALPYFKTTTSTYAIWFILSKDNMWSWINNIDQYSRCVRVLYMSLAISLTQEEIGLEYEKCVTRLQKTQYQFVDEFKNAARLIVQEFEEN